MVQRRSRDLGNIFVVTAHHADSLRRRPTGNAPDPAEFPPPVDIHEHGGSLVVSVELPGVGCDQVRVAVSQNIIVVEGVKESTISSERVVYHCMERYYGRFRRVIEMPRPVNLHEADAQYVNGLLTITVPLVDDRRGQWKTIPIR